MPPASVTLNAILGVLQSRVGQKFCAPCLAKAAGIADANEVRRVMDRAGLAERGTSEIPDLVIGHEDECDSCHTVRRTLSTPHR
jgi:hypothetical protein